MAVDRLGPGSWSRPTLSYEFFPPRTSEASATLWRTVEELRPTAPDFVSVTYGAGGSTRSASLDVVRRMLTDPDLRPVAHLTCVGAGREEIEHLVADFLDAGVRNFLALRGDPPRERAGWRPRAGGPVYAVQLIDLLRRVAASRTDVAPEDLAIGVAAFPAGHPQSGSRAEDVAVLAAKERAGASFAITQLFFRVEDYTDLVAAARRAGVGIPIVPGIMPLVSPARLRRITELAGQVVPRDLLDALEGAEGRAQYEVGVRATVDLARQVLACGAPGIHLYTLNRHEAASDIVGRLGSWRLAAAHGPGPTRGPAAPPAPRTPVTSTGERTDPTRRAPADPTRDSAATTVPTGGTP